MSKKLRRWTLAEEQMLLNFVNASHGNIRTGALTASARLNRTTAACEFKFHSLKKRCKIIDNKYIMLKPHEIATPKTEEPATAKTRITKTLKKPGITITFDTNMLNDEQALQLYRDLHLRIHG